jgi:hypothetical protein
MHKTQCKILRRINEEDLKDYSDSRTWVEYRRCSVIIQTKLIAEIDAKQNRSNTAIWCRI